MSTEFPFVQISSFGRRQTKHGARGLGGLNPFGYRNTVTIFDNLRVQVHTLVQVYFNDPQLLDFDFKTARSGDGKVSIDHKNPSFEMKGKNHWWMLQWATSSEQRKNQACSETSKASRRAKLSVGWIKARMWRNRVQSGGKVVGGEPDEWKDELSWLGSVETAKRTGHTPSSVLNYLDDGLPHFCRANGQSWEYKLIPLQDECVYENEDWKPIPGMIDVFASNMGRIKRGKALPMLGTKTAYYRKVEVDRTPYLVHELIGWTFFGERPSEAHTVDHGPVLDSDGCLSNAVDNLRGWATKSEQSTTSRNGSKNEVCGKPVWVRFNATGVTKEFEDAATAATYLGVTRGYFSQLCNGKKCATFDAGFVAQPSLVFPHLKVDKDGIVKCVLEIERWKDVNPDDWVKGGKYFRARWEQKKRKDVSTHESRKKGKRDDKEADALSGTRRIAKPGAGSSTTLHKRVCRAAYFEPSSEDDDDLDWILKH